MGNEVEVYTAPATDITLSRSPEVVLAEAKKAAVALKDVLDKKTKKVMMNGEQYLELEDWSLLGRFYGITAKIDWTRYVEFGNVKGWESRAVAVRADGLEISAAEAMCLDDEDRWHSRSKFGYVDGQKQKLGEEPVPMFQLRSMAQTRACSKVLRNVLSWVVVLAGYKGTPAEEIEDVIRAKEGKPEGEGSGRKITEGMKRLLHVLCGKLGVKEEKEQHDYVEVLIVELTGKAQTVTSFAELDFDLGRKVIDALQAKLNAKAPQSGS